VSTGYQHHKRQQRLRRSKMPKKGLYDNINKRKKAGTSRSKKDSTIDKKTYKKMTKKKGGFAPKKKAKGSGNGRKK
jgi:hypothetical protein